VKNAGAKAVFSTRSLSQRSISIALTFRIMNAEVPFKISISDDKIAQLRAKLGTVTFPDELEDAGWAYGAPLADIKRIVARWQNGFDWRAQEKNINEELCQFTRDINVDGFGSLNIHYVHQKSQAEDAIPLLFVHGCEYPFVS
jgi:Epoxide hydrolase N terminus